LPLKATCRRRKDEIIKQKSEDNERCLGKMENILKREKLGK
jgi:hypothetical protein